MGSGADDWDNQTFDYYERIAAEDIEKEVRRAGCILFLDTDYHLKIYPASNPHAERMGQLCRGRHAELKMFLIKRATRSED
jgi:hypothetical protein